MANPVSLPIDLDVKIHINGCDFLIPKDIWKNILSQIPKFPNYKHVISFAASCKAFYEISLQSSEIFKGSRIQRLIATSQPQKISELRSFNAPLPLESKFLTVSKEGTRLIRDANKPSIFFIIPYSKKTGAFSYHKVNLLNALKTSAPNQYLQTETQQAIKSAHFMDQEVIIVTSTGVARLDYREGELSNPRFYHPDDDRDFLASSALQGKTLILLTNMGKLLRLDFSTNDVKFIRVESTLVLSGKLLNYESNNKILFSDTLNDEIQVLNWTPGDPEPFKLTPLMTHKEEDDLNCFGSDQWLFYSDLLSSRVKNLHSDQEKDLIFYLPTVSSINHEFYIHYSSISGCSIIHLPSKKNITKDLLPLLNPYLQDGKLLVSLGCSFNPNETLLTALFRNQKLENATTYYEVIFSFSDDSKLPISLKKGTPKGLCNRIRAIPKAPRYMLILGVVLSAFSIIAYVLMKQYLPLPAGTSFSLPNQILLIGGILGVSCIFYGMINWYCAAKVLPKIGVEI